jgi:hypothetical protein
MNIRALWCALTVVIMALVSDGHTSDGDGDCEELGAEHVDSGNAGKFGDGIELVWKCWSLVEVIARREDRAMAESRWRTADGVFIWQRQAGRAITRLMWMKILCAALRLRVKDKPTVHFHRCGGRSTQVSPLRLHAASLR